ncbi:hypothetical protein KIN20_000516 [Parelaphostrongylus tenuis]|uniref:SLC12A transporter C-terminal domain-containing protein n=1 Tax=Parelaphostrongylus tenuis TaxID=148309 RepID=A0AAD5LSB3_PARTN|nr:hypothetical protein KIN20_000516 [Parelaphostrongylus tenuis]
MYSNNIWFFDVWWLRDDGGLTVLLPYLLQLPGTYLEGARLRVFTEGRSNHRVPEDQKDMATLLRKFGVKSSDLECDQHLRQIPKQSNSGRF